MKVRLIYLADHYESVLQACKKRNQFGYDYSHELLDKSIADHVSDNLRYNPVTGKTYNNSIGCVSEYVNSADVVVYDSDSDAAEWAFCGMVRNSANMLSRGFKTI